MPTPDKQLQNQRRRDLAAIHTGRKDLGLKNDDTWRDFVERSTGGRSVAALDATGRRKLLAAITATNGDKHRPARKPRTDLRPDQRAILGRWIELAKAGVIQDRSDKALDAFVGRQTGVSALKWLPPEQTAPVLEALKAMTKRGQDGKKG